MSEWVHAVKLSELQPGRGRFVRLEAQKLSLALFLVDGAVYAIDNTCPHRMGDLAEGDLDGLVVYCPLHAWMFDLRTGKSPSISHAQVRAWPVRVTGDEVEVDTAAHAG